MRIKLEQPLEGAGVAKPPKLLRLREVIQENLRVQQGGLDTIEYINVGNALSDAKTKQNHVIFARRGCGKTLLLHYSSKTLPSNVRCVYLNCENFKNHSFPNVLIEILEALFREMERNLTSWFGRGRKLRKILGNIIEELNSLKKSEDVAEESVKDQL